uniref:Dimer_Tnp_hAT domain-containing protein n=1 Tax=Caenorhabditis tropicalis TaxID=1561998 RepID=A0A1I7SXY2_9PELO
MSGVSKFILRDFDVVLSAALAISLELSSPGSSKPSSKLTPTPYFSRNDSDVLIDDYQPQCDKMMTDVDEEIAILRDTITLDNHDDVVNKNEIKNVRTATAEASVNKSLEELPEEILEEMPEKSTRQAPKTRAVIRPTRRSSRVLIRSLAEEKQRKKKAEKPVKRKNENYKDRLRMRRDNDKTLNEEKKQRKVIEEATKATLRVFGVVGSEKTRSGEANVVAWRNWNKTSTSIIEKVIKNSSASVFRESHFTLFLANSVTAMEKTMLAARPRPAETHNLMLNFIVDFHLIWEIASKHGVTSGIYDIARLWESVVGKYLSSEKLMNPTHLPWIQTKQIFVQLLSIIAKVDTLFDMLTLVSKMMNAFLAKYIHRTHVQQEFKAYAVSQLTEFSQLLSRRLSHLALVNKYNI